jgi:hypothetical protein
MVSRETDFVILDEVVDGAALASPELNESSLPAVIANNFHLTGYRKSEAILPAGEFREGNVWVHEMPYAVCRLFVFW